MKRWAFVTVFLYGLLLLLLTVPVIKVSFIGDNLGLEEIYETYHMWWYWAWLGIMILSQTLLLIIPVDLSQRKLVSRRKLLVPVITSGFFMALILLTGILNVCVAIGGDDGIGFLFPVDTDTGGLILLIIYILSVWIFWSIMFSKFRRGDEEGSTVNRLTKWLISGSILELLIAVPSHVIVRQRNDCCAPAVTFWGITTGLSVMLIAFGPAVFFLFAKRFGRLKPKAEDEPNVIDDKRE